MDHRRPAGNSSSLSLVRGKAFRCREWALGRLGRALESPCAAGGGVLITGGPGSGKTALCTEALWPTSPGGRRAGLGEAVLAFHFCHPHDAATRAPAAFLLGLAAQVARCPALPPGARRRLSRPDAQRALQPSACKRDPDEVFRRAVLLPLLDLPPPSKHLLMIVDGLDVTCAGSVDSGAEWGPPPGPSQTIAHLLSSHLQLLPPWLLLVCTARTYSKGVLHLFPGFQRLCLDDLRREPVVYDVQQYILARLDSEEALRRHLTCDTAEALSQLHIKSNGCLLYLEWVLDGVAAELITLREVCHIPGTLYGLYLWLCQRLFPSHGFAHVRPLLEILLATPHPLTPEQLYTALWTRQPLPWAAFEDQLAAAGALLQEGPDGTRLLFHGTFAEWLCDVKHCTLRYLCCPARGHTWLAMSASCRAPKLLPEQVHQLARHLLLAELGLAPWQLALWLVWCQAPVECCLDSEEETALLPPVEPRVLELLVLAGARLGDWGPGGPSLQYILEHEESVRLLLENGANVNQRDASGRTLLASAAHGGHHEVVGLLLAHGAKTQVPDQHGQTPLILAARQGHTKVLLCLLAHGASVDRPDHEGWTGLRAAAWGGHSEAVRVLLHAGANVDGVDAEGRTALRAAAWGGHEDIVAMLVEQGAEVNLADTEGRTALIAAAYMGHREIVALLLSHGAHVDHADMDGHTALSVAALCVPASRGYAKVVELLLDYGASPGHADRDGMTPLLVAAYEGHIDVLELLLEAGAEVDEADTMGCTPLLAAASMGHRVAVDTLLLWGAAINVLDSEGRTALGVAAGQGSEAVVRALLKRGLDENHRDGMGWTPLHLAAWQGHTGTCATLVEAGARVSETNRDGRGPLMVASQEGHTEVVQLLLERGAPIDHQGYDGFSALSLAMLGNHRATAELLLRKGAEVNLSATEGPPLLYLLLLRGHLEMAELLLENGARLEGRDGQGRTALHLTCWQGHENATQLLLSYGADVDAGDRECRSALHVAAWRGHTRIARLLLERGAQPNHTCHQGATALAVAAQEGQAEVASVLLEFGADPNVLDKAGRTPTHMAARQGHYEVLRLLKSHGASPGPTNPQLGSSVSAGSSPLPHGPRGNSPLASLDSLLGESFQSPGGSSSEATTSTFHSLATAQTVPMDSLSFAQQIQQLSLPRRRQAALGTRHPSGSQDPGGATISIDMLDPQLYLKAAIKLQFEGPTCGYEYKQETPL